MIHPLNKATISKHIGSPVVVVLQDESSVQGILSGIQGDQLILKSFIDPAPVSAAKGKKGKKKNRVGTSFSDSAGSDDFRMPLQWLAQLISLKEEGPMLL